METTLEKGLSQVDVQARLATYGPNQLVERGIKSHWRILWEQMTAVMVVILVIAAVISVAIGDFKDAVAILAIVILNAILGFVQEYRAERAMLALKQLAVPVVKVRRDGRIQEIPSVMMSEQKTKILLVDDEESILSTLKIFLDLSGFAVMTARNGGEALDRVTQHRPDLIVLDVLMPQLDGRETLRRLRRQGDWTPVILLTQVTGTAQRIMAIEEGADDYIRAVLRRTQAGKQPLQSSRRLRSGRLWRPWKRKPCVSAA